MTSPHRFISQIDNRAAQAAVSASSVMPSSAVRALPSSRTGNARVSISGAYTADESDTLELRIASGGVPIASDAAFNGVGNGTLEVLGVATAAPLQALTLTLASTGTRTVDAALELGPVRLVAVAAGAAGNAVRISVAPNLVFAPLSVTTLAEWPAGQPSQPGAQWEVLGGAPLRSDGSLDAALCPRVRFGESPQVYRVYQVFKDGAWQTGLSPAPQTPIRKGEAVYAVSGTYTVTVSDGVATETQPGVTTLYDWLLALSGSALLRVDGALVRDERPGGMAAIDLPLRSSAWLKEMRGSIRPQELRIAPNGPTQTVTVQCIDATLPGAEVWRVDGSVSGRLANAMTGARYESEVASFILPPPQTVTGATAAASVLATRWDYLPRDRQATEPLPRLCMKLAAGARATSQTVRFVYKRKPVQAPCPCPTLPSLSSACLGGVINFSGGTDMSDLAPAVVSRLQTLFQWRSDFASNNTSLLAPKPNVAEVDLLLSDSIARQFSSALVEIFSVPAALAEWDAALVDMQAELEVISSNDVYAAAYPALGSIMSSAVNGVAKNDAGYWRLLSFSPGAMTETIVGPPLVPPIVPDTTVVDDHSPNYSSTWEFLGPYFSMGGVTSSSDLAEGVGALTKKWAARMDYCRTLAGLLPKSDASSTRGAASGCWQDDPSATHWWVDESGTYLPAFTNKAYYSARRDDHGDPISTQEFGMVIGCGCPEHLREGDVVQIRLNAAASGADTVRRVGDTLEFDIIGAQPLALRGGVDGADAQTWSVSGSVSGALPDYVLAYGPSTDYTAAGVTLRINHGGIAFALGDSFTLGIEAGQVQWRKGDGVWSPPVDLPAGGAPLAIVDGLSAAFAPGRAPSFVSGDVFRFALEQPAAPSGALRPDADAWRWVGPDAVLTLSWPGPVSVEAVASVWRELPDAAQVFAQWSADGSTWSAEQALSRAGSLALLTLEAPQTVRALRLRASAAEGAALVWAWAGVPRRTRYAASVVLKRQWAMTQGDALNPSTLFAGSGMGGTVSWDVLSDEEVRALLAMLDDNQRHGWPMLFLPHVAHQHDAALVRVDATAIDLVDEFDWQPNEAAQRVLRMTLPLQAVYQ